MSDHDDPETFERPISAWLATVLAAAAKGSRSRSPIYVVARYEPDLASPTTPFDVQSPVGTRDEAEQVKRKLEEEHPGIAYGVFGPFINEDPSPPSTQDMVADIMVTTKQGHQLPIKGHQYDALFYTYQAVEKFVLPLYVQEYGPEYAARVLEEFNQNGLALMAHLPWSEEVLQMDLRMDPMPHGAPVLFAHGDGGEPHQTPLLPPPGGKTPATQG